MKKNSKSNPLKRLSPRESEVLDLVVEGQTSREIAARLGVKPSSVQTYRRRIMEKLEADNTAHLVRLAIRRGLIYP